MFGFGMCTHTYQKDWGCFNKLQLSYPAEWDFLPTPMPDFQPRNVHSLSHSLKGRSLIPNLSSNGLRAGIYSKDYPHKELITRLWNAGELGTGHSHSKAIGLPLQKSNFQLKSGWHNIEYILFQPLREWCLECVWAVPVRNVNNSALSHQIDTSVQLFIISFVADCQVWEDALSCLHPIPCHIHHRIHSTTFCGIVICLHHSSNIEKVKMICFLK